MLSLWADGAVGAFADPAALGWLPFAVGIVLALFTAGSGAAIVNGVQRGMLSNEAGMGSVPNVVAIALINLVVIVVLAPTARRLLADLPGEGGGPVFLSDEMPDLQHIETWDPEDVSDCVDARDAGSTAP